MPDNVKTWSKQCSVFFGECIWHFKSDFYHRLVEKCSMLLIPWRCTLLNLVTRLPHENGLKLVIFLIYYRENQSRSDPNDLILQSNQTNQFRRKKTLNQLLKVWTFEVVEWCLQASTSNIWYWVSRGVKRRVVVVLERNSSGWNEAWSGYWQPAVGPVPELGGLGEQGRLIVEEPHNSNFPPFGPDPPARPHQRVPHQHLACPCKRLFNPS